MDRIIVILYFALVLTSACTKSQSNAFKLDSTSAQSIDFETTKQIIQLESNTEAPLGYIMKSYVDFENKKIFISSFFNLYVFDISGRYLNKLKVGRGPGEVSMITGFDVDEENKRIYAIDNSTRICAFDYNCEFQESFDIVTYPSNDIYILGNDSILLLRNCVGGREKHFIGLYDTSKDSIVQRYVSSNESLYPENNIVMTQNFCEYNQDLYFYSSNIFGFYKYENRNFQQILTFDLNKHTVPESLYKKYAENDHCEMRDEAKSRNYIPYLIHVFPFNNYYFVVVDDNENSCFIVDKKNELYYSNSLTSCFDLPGDDLSFVLTFVNNNVLVFSGMPSGFFDKDDDKESKTLVIGGKILEINKTDNPFLVIVQPKL